LFSALIDRCDAVVTGVTMAMHLAIGMGTPLVLINNIFNPREFELYDNGEIVNPPKPCDCFYDRTCRTKRECIREITPDAVLAALLRVIHKASGKATSSDLNRTLLAQ
jgi:ADP-heptose:LPS heptosyltransferase